MDDFGVETLAKCELDLTPGCVESALADRDERALYRLASGEDRIMGGEPIALSLGTAHSTTALYDTRTHHDASPRIIELLKRKEGPAPSVSIDAKTLYRIKLFR